MRTEFRILVLLALLPLLGTVGFMAIEGWGAFDAFYMSIITLTTVGYHEVHPLSTAGRAFVIVFLVAGSGVFFFGIVRLGELAVRSEIRDWMGWRFMNDQLKALSRHYVVCGSGRMGRTICRELAGRGLPFVVVDRSEAAIRYCQEQKWISLLGDATDDTVLEEAGIHRAGGLAAVLSSDADNMYVVMSARLLSPDLPIVARVDDEKSEVKLRKAGANRIISMYAAGGLKVAQLLANPELEDFLEIFTHSGTELDLAEVHVSADGPFAGKSLDESSFRGRGVIVVGIRHQNGELLFNPPPATTLQPEDQVIIMGSSKALGRILKLE
ncbi:MAG: TrkA family potassium uptake protein [Pirellulales bacterium]